MSKVQSMKSLSKTDKQWQAWGRKNPYMGVLGVESSDMKSVKAEEEFFASGEAHIRAVLDIIERFYPSQLTYNRALDFGCGVGRLIRPLSTRFHAVTGVDVSPEMINLAKQNIAPKANVDFFANVSEIGPEVLYDLVHSYIVIQHIRPAQGYEIMKALLKKVRPGGFFALHFTVGDLDRKRRFLNKVRYRVRPLHWAYNLVRRRPWNEPITEMNEYQFARVIDLLKGSYDGSFLVRGFDQNRHVGVMVIGQIPNSSKDK